MKNKLITLGILSAMFVGGCASSNVSPTDPNFAALVQKDRQEVKTDAQVAVAVYLGLVSTDADRAKTGALAYQIAEVVNKSVKEGSVSVPDVRQYVVDLITKSNSKDSQKAGLIANAIILVVQNHLDTKFTLPTEDSRNQVAKELILGATEGVMESTVQFKNSVPRTVALPPIHRR
jgi:hypothetical protein